MKFALLPILILSASSLCAADALTVEAQRTGAEVNIPLVVIDENDNPAESVEFAPGCGAYIRKKSNDASFNTAYAADTNAVYLSRIPFSSEKDLASNKILSVSLILNPDEYMVLRTRATYDAVGNPTNWCYSKVEGKIVVNRRL